ncbi:hypothetical protein CHS0354_005495 [Potamilus streckersoni]|uniref:RRM domain-containing protein n=1 Tax=Potamilus streckersoni TaxID=2493646 RepID=A0AAE0SG60_9BIVA|nr:hypothetical protein CHS0354_005495 [Potamilus streckersoni]
MDRNWFIQWKERSRPCPNEKKVRELLKDKTYRLKITPYQRRYGAHSPAPEDVRELFVCRIPKRWFEDKLIPLFQEFGKIYEVRLITDKCTGYNRGFCFVRYYKKEDTEKALGMLNKYEVKPGWTLKADFQSLNSRLRLQNIPRDKSVEELREDFEKVSLGIKDVTALRAMSKLKSQWRLHLGYKVAVKWDYPEEEPDEAYMSKVKVVHVRNLMTNTKKEDLKKKFEKFGNVERVNVVRDLGFVQFEKREDALTAIEEMNGKVFGKYEIVCCLSRKTAKLGMKREHRK